MNAYIIVNCAWIVIKNSWYLLASDIWWVYSWYMW